MAERSACIQLITNYERGEGKRMHPFCGCFDLLCEREGRSL